MRNLYLTKRLFALLSVVMLLFVLAFFIGWLLPFVRIFLGLVILAAIIDYAMLFGKKNGVIAQRILPEKLSNGDENPVKLDVKNDYPFTIETEIIDEVPFQFQMRDFNIKRKIESKKNVFLQYILEPKERGEFVFGALNVYAKSAIGLVSKRYRFQKDASLPSYPSFIHLGKYELQAIRDQFLLGARKVRRIGHQTEFEQIKDYVPGDDIRTINWKATSKRNHLMVNQYQEERSQRIWMIIDRGRTMQMPFGGLSLLDYSINAAMALSHIVLKKGDRAGMMTFSKTAENRVPAESKAGQLRKISEALYNIRTNFYESDFGALYRDIRQNISQRSLILLFTNFETLDAVNRQTKFLRAIARNHLVVVVFFKNSELQKIIHRNPENMQEIYDEIIAEKFEFEKKLIIQELRKYGIYSLYTLPENLSVEAINKYLEIKAQGLL